MVLAVPAVRDYIQEEGEPQCVRFVGEEVRQLKSLSHGKHLQAEQVTIAACTHHTNS